VKVLSATLAALLGIAASPALLHAQPYQGPPAGAMISPYAAGGSLPQYSGYSPYGMEALIGTPIAGPSGGSGSGLAYGPSTGAPCHGSDCQHCCPSHCVSGCCLHRSSVFAEFLYWDVRGIDMPYAVPQNGIGGAGTVPIGDVHTANFDPDDGFRFGFNVALDCRSSVGATLTWFETNTEDALLADAPNVIQPLVLFPGTFNAGFTGQQASAGYGLEMQMIDIDYRAVWLQGPCYHVNYLAGARYAHIDQNFSAAFPFAPPDGMTFVETAVNFDGAGIRFGLEGERALGRTGLLLYGKSAASLLGGNFRASYSQVNQFNGLEAQNDWDDSRVVPIGELELGLAWSGCDGFVRLSAGYYFACWNNVVTTPDWVNGVQNLNFTDVGQDEHDSITFDGLVARLELTL
jgi:hypothetical protein